jgi:hypothetical protein
MKRGSTSFLKLIIVLIAMVVLTWMIVFPQLEGRATNLDLISIYRDPLIIYGYVASIPFFVALFQAFKLLSCVEKNTIISRTAVRSVRIVKYCAIAIPVLIVFGESYIVFGANGDDFAGPVALGMYATFISIVIATSVAIFEKLLQHAVDIKSENDLTV